MRLLLDTHTFIWWVSNSKRIPKSTFLEITDEENDIFVSAATAWEIATKHRIGKLREVGGIVADLPDIIKEQGFEELPITVDDGVRAGMFPLYHRDPFDRVLIAQAISRNLALVSGEALFDRYGVRRVW